MIYKPLKYIVNKRELQKNTIIYKNNRLHYCDKSVITGRITNAKGMAIEGCGIALLEISIDKCSKHEVFFTFTDIYGMYYIDFYPKTNKLYSIAVYYNIDT